MVIHPSLADFIICPQCQGGLDFAAKDHVYVCKNCRLCFNAPTGGAHLLMEHAASVTEKGTLVPLSQDYIALHPTQGPVAEIPHPSGKAPASLRLPKGSCLAVVRATDADTQHAENLDITSYLNDTAKAMLASFMKSRSRSKQRTDPDSRFFYNFRRLPDLVIKDHAISKAHCLFFYDDSGAGVVDLFSRNGTYVNGKEIEACALSRGDIVHFGQSAVEIQPV